MFVGYDRHLLSYTGVAAIVAACMLVFAPVAALAADMPVNLQARQLTHDDATQEVTALGDVEFVQGDRVLRAEKVVYNLATDTVRAIGNVSVLDETGDVHFMEYAELSGDLKNGFVQGLLTLLVDGSRFTAAESRREDGNRITMMEATYTPCKVCEADPDPMWQIKADEVVHDAEQKSIRYKNARVEVMGVPVAYTPVFSHADPTVKRKSGFLRPDYGWSNELGTYVEGGYYFGDIAPHMDATVALRPTTRAGTLVMGQWRQRFEEGYLQLDGSVVQSDRVREDGTIARDRNRGHIFGHGLFEINDAWRAGFNVERSSDIGYLRLYDISSKNVLESEAYAERLAGRDYTRVSLMDFQDVRLGTRPDQPEVLPRIEHRMYGDAGGMLGGRWTVGGSALGLLRRGDGQDVQRGEVDVGWERRDIHASGFVTRVHASAQGDIYNVHDNTASLTDPTLGKNTRKTRGTVTAGVQASYPLVKRMERAQVVVEPVAGVIVSPARDMIDPRVPNEDSIDMQLDAGNLFSANRSPGLDIQEDGTRVSYGLKTGVHGDNGHYARAFVGQSYRFSDNGVFAAGSGLDDHASDVVGQMSVGIADAFNADYRVQLDGHDMSMNRQELFAQTRNKTFNVEVGYIYLSAVQGTGFNETREQASVGGEVRLNDRWSVNGNVLHDLGEDNGLRRAGIGLNYVNDCLTWSLQGVRNLVDDATGESGTALMMRIGFKNIGEFTTPRITLQESGVGTN